MAMTSRGRQRRQISSSARSCTATRLNSCTSLGGVTCCRRRQAKLLIRCRQVSLDELVSKAELQPQKGRTKSTVSKSSFNSRAIQDRSVNLFLVPNLARPTRHFQKAIARLEHVRYIVCRTATTQGLQRATNSSSEKILP
jgi:hypothetical protein